MSYILESLKKSDDNRVDTNDLPNKLKVPAYLSRAAEEPKQWWLVPAVAAVFVIGGLTFWFFQEDSFFQNSKISISSIADGPQISNRLPAAEDSLMVDGSILVEDSLPIDDSSKSNTIEELYQNAVTRQDRQPSEIKINTRVNAPTIDTTYLEPEPLLLENLASSNEEQNIATLEALPLTTEETPSVKIDAIARQAEPDIASIFSFDVLTQRTIPDIKYGAHIYASDNNSGFVILNGAKKQVGDKLRSGIHIEKINAENVILSYNGLLFSLPALKSWSYQ